MLLKSPRFIKVLSEDTIREKEEIRSKNQKRNRIESYFKSNIGTHFLHDGNKDSEVMAKEEMKLK